MGRKIVVCQNPEIAVEFLQRAEGEETPYYVGRLHLKVGKSWKEAGSFSNNGCGGSTIVHAAKDLPVNVVDHLTDVAKKTAESLQTDLMMYESGMIVDYAAHLIDIGAAHHELTFAEFITINICDPHMDSLLGSKKTEQQIQAFKAARSKARALEARKYAKKGKSVVYLPEKDGCVGYEMIVVNSLDRSNVEKLLLKKGIKEFEFPMAV